MDGWIGRLTWGKIRRSERRALWVSIAEIYKKDILFLPVSYLCW